MRRAMLFLVGLMLLAPAPVRAAGGRETTPALAIRHLQNAQVVGAPETVGRRSPIGPQLYRRVVDSVVLVVTNEGFGSGVLVTAEGHVLTNWHVVEGYDVVGVVRRQPELLAGMDRLREEHVTLGRVVAVDAKRDLALLMLTSVAAALRTVPLGAAGGVEVGQDVYALGHPGGLLWSYAEGVVSQIRPDYAWTFREGSQHRATVIQTQVPLHQGSSGGAIFDGDARIVGITFGQQDATLNFAIAVSEVRDWILSLTRR